MVQLIKEKLGTYGLISNFSFYYAHHMSTIEGGMICTNNKDIYERARIFRSHGMSREVKDSNFKKNRLKNIQNYHHNLFFYTQLSILEIMRLVPRLDLIKLKRLNQNNNKRTKNLKLFLKLLTLKSIGQKYKTDYDLKGSSNYAEIFP